MVENPWQVDSIQAFSYFKCPECIFDSQEEGIFQEHAIENHPLSLVLFGKTALKEEEFDKHLTIEEEKPESNDDFKVVLFS